MSGVIGEPDGATLLAPDELDGLKYKHIQTRNELDELEQANIQAGLLWLSKVRNKNVLSEGFIRKLHKRLFGDVWSWAGTFRTTEKNIGVDPIQIGVQLRMLLDDASYWAGHATYLPLEAAARFHHRLVQIHCFANGNGRHARIAADAYLEERFRHEPVDWAGGFNLMKSNERRDDYITSLRAADAGNYEPLLKFVCVKTIV
ncbi:MAG: mobile mystery protein B [Geminicoccales bacterium]